MLQTIKFSIIGLGLALGIAGCVGRIQKSTQQPQPSPAASVQARAGSVISVPTALLPSAASNGTGAMTTYFKTYRDEQHQFSFQYPSTWELSAFPESRGDLLFVAAVPIQNLESGNRPPGAWMLRVKVGDNPDGLTEQRWLKQYLEGKYYFLEEKNINGIRWSQFDLLQAGRFPTTPLNPFLVAAIGENIYLFEGHTGATAEAFDQLETVVRTAEFAGQQVPPEVPQWEYWKTQGNDFMIKIPPRWKARQYDAGGFSSVVISPSNTKEGGAKVAIDLVSSTDFFGKNKKDFISWVKKGGFTYDDKKPTIAQSEVIPLGGKDVIRQVEDGKQMAYYADLGEVYFDMKYSLTDPDSAIIEEMVNTIIFHPTEKQAEGVRGIP